MRLADPFRFRRREELVVDPGPGTNPPNTVPSRPVGSARTPLGGGAAGFEPASSEMLSRRTTSVLRPRLARDHKFHVRRSATVFWLWDRLPITALPLFPRGDRGKSRQRSWRFEMSGFLDRAMEQAQSARAGAW